MIKLMSPIFFATALLLLPFTSRAENTNLNLSSVESTVWAWAEVIDGEQAIVVSRQQGSECGEIEKISDNKTVNVVPAVTQMDDGDLMIAWSAFAGQRAELHYRQEKKGVWQEEKKYYSGLSSNTAPSLALDANGVLWLVWDGFNGISDEIFYTSWNGNSFETGQPITSNGIPDILPVLGVDEQTGRPWVQWQRYSPSGYEYYESVWIGAGWSDPARVTVSEDEAKPGQKARSLARFKQIARTIKLTSEGIPQSSRSAEAGEALDLELPSCISAPASASLHLPGYTVQSLPVRNMIITE